MTDYTDKISFAFILPRVPLAHAMLLNLELSIWLAKLSGVHGVPSEK